MALAVMALIVLVGLVLAGTWMRDDDDDSGPGAPRRVRVSIHDKGPPR